MSSYTDLSIAANKRLPIFHDFCFLILQKTTQTGR